MTHKLKFAYVSLHIMTGLYVLFALIGIGAFFDASMPPFLVWLYMSLFAAFAIGNELVVRGLKQRKFWAWVTALVLSAGSILPLGIFGLYGLLAAGSRAEFGLGKTTAPQN
jgi:hypothetical protein